MSELRDQGEAFGLRLLLGPSVHWQVQPGLHLGRVGSSGQGGSGGVTDASAGSLALCTASEDQGSVCSFRDDTAGLVLQITTNRR